MLSGFTLRNGSALNATELEGGGIAIEKASPTITYNVIEGNLGAVAGGGIGIGFGSPVIKRNIIRNNSQTPTVDSGIGGGGISVRLRSRLNVKLKCPAFGGRRIKGPANRREGATGK